MKIKLRLFANLKDFSPSGREVFELEMAGAALVSDLTTRLGIPDKVQRVVLINGRNAEPDDPLIDNAEVVLFPPVEGG